MVFENMFVFNNWYSVRTRITNIFDKTMNIIFISSHLYQKNTLISSSLD